MTEQTEQHLRDPRPTEGLRYHPHLHEPGDTEDDSTDSDSSWNYEESAKQENGDDGREMQSGSEDTQGGAPLQDEVHTQIETESHLLSLTPDPAPHPAYVHLDPGYIRLFKIIPGEPASSLCIDIEPVSLLGAPEYTAISYAWGSPHASWEIKVNGVRFLVPTNLMRFLKQAKDFRGILSGWLWVDMLSIDQANSSERAQQVIMMPQIFGQATRVVVWLGPAYTNSDAAMTTLAKSSSHWQQKKNRLQLWASSTGLGVQALCQRLYWHRLWVFQELRVAKARHLMCGSKMIGWDRFEKFLLFAEQALETHRLDNRVEVIKSSPAMQMAKLRSQPADATLWTLIQRTTHLRCADIRDRAYALLGVINEAQDKTRVEIFPDYDIPIPAFLNSVLKKVSDTLPPRDLREAQQRCEEVERTLAVQPGTIYVMQDKQGLYEDIKDLDMQSCRLRPKSSSMSLWWAHYYGHFVVQKLLLDSWSYEFWQSDHSLQRHHTTVDGATMRSELAKALIDAHATINESSPFGAVQADIRHVVFDKLINPSKRSTDEHSSDFPTILANNLYLAILQGDLDLAQLLLAPEGLLASLDNRLSAGLLKLATKGETAYNVAHELAYGALPGLGFFLDEKTLPQVNDKMPLLLYSVLARAHDSVLAILNAKRCDANQMWTGAKGASNNPISALQLAAYLGSIKSMHVLLDRGPADVNLTCGRYKSPLMFAAAGPSSECVKALLEKPGCDVNMSSSEGTALHCAAGAGNSESVRLLLEIGNADVNILSDNGRTALFDAARSGNSDCARILLENERCEVNATSASGRTALAYAVGSGNFEVAQLLLGHHAEVNTVDSVGKTPLDIAHDVATHNSSIGNELKSMLLQAGANYLRTGQYPRLQVASLGAAEKEFKRLIDQVPLRGA